MPSRQLRAVCASRSRGSSRLEKIPTLVGVMALPYRRLRSLESAAMAKAAAVGLVVSSPRAWS
jgi:hypothetical protein